MLGGASGVEILDIRRFSGVVKCLPYRKGVKVSIRNQHRLTGEIERDGVWGRGGVEPTTGLLGVEFVFNLWE